MPTHHANRAHTYATRLEWVGNRGTGTARYTGYDRDYRIAIDGRPTLEGSSDAAFRGRTDRHNPEDLLVAALSACHLLAYLALCARSGVRVEAYEDAATGTLVLDADGGGRFTEVVLAPVVTIAGDADEALALQLHDTAHAQCFIASSCNFPVRHRATIVRAPQPTAAPGAALRS